MESHKAILTRAKHYTSSNGTILEYCTAPVRVSWCTVQYYSSTLYVNINCSNSPFPVRPSSPYGTYPVGSFTVKSEKAIPAERRDHIKDWKLKVLWRDTSNWEYRSYQPTILVSLYRRVHCDYQTPSEPLILILIHQPSLAQLSDFQFQSDRSGFFDSCNTVRFSSTIVQYQCFSPDSMIVRSRLSIPDEPPITVLPAGRNMQGSGCQDGGYCAL